MATFLEGDPGRGIVDVDTFVLWLGNSYEASLLADPSVPKSTQFLSPQSVIKLSAEATEDTDLLRMGTVIIVDNYPWGEVPESLQEVITKEYPSASQPDEKSIGIKIEFNSRLSFWLNSPQIVDQIDQYGETFSPGISLHLTAPEKGRWIWYQGSAAIAERIRRSIDELFEQRKSGLIPSERPVHFLDIKDIDPNPDHYGSMPATVPQLQDTARLLVKAKSLAKMTRFT